jgi:hypothetical protein
MGSMSAEIPTEWGDLSTIAEARMGAGAARSLKDLRRISAAVQGIWPLDGETIFGLGWIQGREDRRTELKRLLRVGDTGGVRPHLIRRLATGWWERGVRTVKEAGLPFSAAKKAYEPPVRGLSWRKVEILETLPRNGLYPPGALAAASLLVAAHPAFSEAVSPEAMVQCFADGVYQGLSVPLPEEGEALAPPERVTAFLSGDFQRPRLFGEFVFASQEVLLTARLWVTSRDAWMSLAPPGKSDSQHTVHLSHREEWDPDDQDIIRAGARLLKVVSRLPPTDRAVLQVGASQLLCRSDAQEIAKRVTAAYETRSTEDELRTLQSFRLPSEDFPLFQPPAGFREIVAEMRAYMRSLSSLTISSRRDDPDLPLGRLLGYSARLMALAPNES